MTIYIVLLLVGAAVAALVIGVAELAAARPRALHRQLALIGQLSRGEPVAQPGAHRGEIRAQLAAQLARLGASMQRSRTAGQPLRELLLQAGFRRADAMTIFGGTRLAATLGLPLAAAAVAGVASAPAGWALLAGVWGGVVGWVGPKVYLRVRARARKAEIDRRLPDALDLLVVCVEAGLGLNQALMRMSEEIRHFSPATADEFTFVTLELRAGVARQEALRNLGMRMGLPELRALSAMLIQADRFGTSIAQSLRVHAETARKKRQQRAEEAAAKTTIKLIFPLVLCIFPTIFVVILGPAMISFVRTLSAL